jgi:hypothetical protein
MLKYHLEHPTQATACGTSSTATVLTPAEFDHVPDGRACKACKRTLDASREGRKSYRSDMRKLVITLPSDLADAIEHYSNTNWNDGRDPSKLGALNAVSYLGERLVALYRKTNGL